MRSNKAGEGKGHGAYLNDPSTEHSCACNKYFSRLSKDVMTAKIRAHNACVSLSICFPTLESWLDLGMRSGVSGVQLSLSCKGPATAWPKLMSSWIFLFENKVQRQIVHCCSRNCFTYLSLPYNMSRPIEQALSNLIPRHPGALPPELIDLARSLLAQSRMKASTLKAEEEIGRTYACANIACERLIRPTC